MKLTLTIEQLKARDACQEGVDAFRSTFGESATVDYTREAQIELMRGPMGRWIGWAHAVGLVPWWNLSRANLSGTDLSRANLSGANLSGANLSGTDLSRANLYRANLAGANLSGANLYRANLYRANLAGDNLAGANLAGTDLYRANLSGTDLSGTDLAKYGWQLDKYGFAERLDNKETQA